MKAIPSLRVLLGVTTALIVAAGPALGATHTVTQTGDSGAGSLRQAILDANVGSGSSQQIVFSIPTADPGYDSGTGIYTIAPDSVLPVILQRTILDGRTQAGYAGTPVIQLDGGAVAGPGLRVDAGGSVVRGLVINRFGGPGVDLGVNSSATVEGNYIGTDPTGTLPLPNGSGIQITQSTNNLIGGTAPDAGNLISGNLDFGVRLVGNGSSSNEVYGNRIGTDVTGLLPLGNGGPGVLVDSLVASTRIGGTASGEGNRVAFNGGAGIVIRSSGGPRRLRGNLIWGNGALGIDLAADGVTLNDPGDVDTGPNNRLNYPILESASIVGPDLVLTGFAGAGLEIDLFLADPDPTGFGEGRIFLASRTEGSAQDLDAATGTYGPGMVNGLPQGTDTAPRFRFDIPLASLPGVMNGTLLTATGTVAAQGTSEFSGIVTVGGVASNLTLVKQAFLTDGTPLAPGATVPNGTRIDFLISIDNPGLSTVSDVSVEDAIGSGFVVQPGTIRIDAAQPTGSSPAQLHAAAAAASPLTDAVDGDAAGRTGATVSAGSAGGHAPVDIAPASVWAMVVTAEVQGGGPNAVRGGIGGVDNGTLFGGNGTGTAALTVSGADLVLIKEARDAAGALLAPGATVQAGDSLGFVLAVDNPLDVAADLALEDLLDEAGFRYVPGTLEAATHAAGTGSPAIWSGSWNSRTDGLGAPDDEASILDTGGAAGADRLTVGAVPGQANQTLSLAADSLVAFRFRVVVEAGPAGPLVNTAAGTGNGAALDGTAATITVNRAAVPTLALVQEARDAAGQVLAPGAAVQAGDSLSFVLVVDNPLAVPRDLELEDLLDEAGFAYIPGTLEAAMQPTGTGSAVIWSGAWSSRTDLLGAPDDGMSMLDTGGPAGADRLTVGPVPGQTNQPVSIPAGLLLAVRFRVVVVPGPAGPLVNAASGSVNGAALDGSAASVTVNRVLIGGTITVSAAPTLLPADGIATSTITVTVRDPLGQPVPGKTILLASDRGAQDTIGQPAGPTDASGVATGTVRSTVPGAARISATNTTDGITAPQTADLVFNAGDVLVLDKTVDRESAMIGEILGYAVEIRNTTGNDVGPVILEDQPPSVFRYRPGSARLDGVPVPDPAPGSSLRFDLGVVPGWVDTNLNGVADPGEPGHRTLTYDLVVGAGAVPGEYTNRVVARDFCPTCTVSLPAAARVRIESDPLFELGTILGKVFADEDGDGIQDAGERGLPEVRVVLDDGTVAVTDSLGRYHFLAVTPGHRAVKIDLATVSGPATTTTEETRIENVTPGLLVKINFGVARETEPARIGRPAGPGYRFTSRTESPPTQILGSTRLFSLLVNGKEVSLPTADVRVEGADPGGIFRFLLDADASRPAAGWSLRFWDEGDVPAHSIEGEMLPAGPVYWDGKKGGEPLLAPGRVYQVQVVITYRGGAIASSPRRLFGVVEDGSRRIPVLDADPRLGPEARRRLAAAYRTDPRVTVEGRPVPATADGRFSVEVPDQDSLDVTLLDASGRSVDARFELPELQVDSPVGVHLLPYGVEQNGFAILSPDSTTGDGSDRVGTVRIEGRSDPGDRVEIDGVPVEVGPDGAFSWPVELRRGANSFGVLARNPEGQARILNLLVDIEDRNADGTPVVAVDPVPALTVDLPPEGMPLRHPHQRISGTTASGNRVTVNGQVAVLDGDGRFEVPLELPVGPSLLEITVTDPEGHQGTLRREVVVEENTLFLLAFADGVIGHLSGSGNLEDAGRADEEGFYTEGRIAFYLKGRVAGNVLITGAFDTGTDEFEHLFDHLDEAGTRRLMRNIDPDRFYPVYGDAAELAYDTESRGTFYLGVSSEEFDFVAGNVAIDFSDTELAVYQRTLFGARLAYTSASRSPEGEPDTRIVLFGAEADLAHARTELRATGGSLYYLRHRDLLEGSEQVSLLVRDKDTGLLLARIPQVRNRDYTIQYPEGRLWFTRPVASVIESGTLVDRGLLSGHPVTIQADYETEAPGLDAAAAGARVERQLGEHLSVGGTYVHDERGDRENDLRGVDAELRLGAGSRLVGEYAETTGRDSLGYVSEDGGLTYQSAIPAEDGGSAWRAAADLDVGSWFDDPDRVRVGGYVRRAEPGFQSGGNLQAVGSRQTGVRVDVDLGSWGRVLGRHEAKVPIGTPAPGVPDTDRRTGAGWRLDRGWIRWGVEVEDRTLDDRDGEDLGGATTVAGRVDARLSSILRGGLEHQQTVDGAENDQTTLDLEIGIVDSLRLTARGMIGDRGESAQGGLVYHTAGTRLYLSERVADTGASRGRSTVMGAERRLSRSSRIYSEYRWERTEEANEALGVLGAGKSWVLAEGLRLRGSAELAHRSQGRGLRSTAAMGLDFRTAAGLRIWTRNEARYDTGEDRRLQLVTDTGTELHLAPDWSLLGKVRYSVTLDRVGSVIDARSSEHGLGLAYRPVVNDRLNGLLRYTKRIDQRPRDLDAPGIDRISIDVVAGEATVDVTSRVAWTEKLALKYRKETGADQPGYGTRTRTLLSIHRVDLRVWKDLELGVEYRLLTQREAEDRRRGWLNELLYPVGEHLRLGVGYNFTDFSDDMLADHDYSLRGWFLRLQGRY